MKKILKKSMEVKAKDVDLVDNCVKISNFKREKCPSENALNTGILFILNKLILQNLLNIYLGKKKNI